MSRVSVYAIDRGAVDNGVRGSPSTKTHELVSLYETCGDAGRRHGLDATVIEVSTPSAIHGRYADDLVDADHGFAPRFVDFAGEVAAVVRSELGANGGGE